MKEKLYELYGFIEQSILYERDWLIKQRLKSRLVAINILLEDLPYGRANIIDEFDKEIK